jgi:hypothetical protein
MRSIAPALCLVLASSVAAYLPFHAPQQPLQVQPLSSSSAYDGHQVWRLEWSGMDATSKRDLREAISVSSRPFSP